MHLDMRKNGFWRKDLFWLQIAAIDNKISLYRRISVFHNSQFHTGGRFRSTGMNEFEYTLKQ